MAESVAKVARRINATAEEGKDSLDLSNCNLISFPDGVFKVLSGVTENIRTVSLADNEMKTISAKFCSIFTQLRELDLHGNVLTKLPDAVVQLEHLSSIDLSGNRFSQFPEKLTELKELERISLEGNTITDFPAERLFSMPSLKVLDLRANPVSAETLGALQTPPHIQLLVSEP
ncbi:leucine-rich repeat-containing protein 20 [Eucyclogobius newberryi]|uniref:leucine-rich repeat-containing protein 20 n=1 Tax=Eucyclogobius newberryi TaxID=166745 RepID=UPI003B5ABEB6